MQIFEQAPAPSHYPTFSLPVTVATLKKLYDRFNRELFGGQLPPDIGLSVSSRMTRVSGIARMAKGGVLSIGIAQHAANNQKKVVEVLVHEMIHIEQFQKFLQTSDRSFYTGKGGHNAYFLRRMKELQARGYQISVKDDELEDVDTGITFYILTATTTRGTSTVYFSKKPFDTDQAAKMIAARLGDLSICRSFETTDASAIQATNISTLARKGRMFVFKQSYIDALLSHVSGKVKTFGPVSASSGIAVSKPTRPVGTPPPASSPWMKAAQKIATALDRSGRSMAPTMTLADFTRAFLSVEPAFKNSVARYMGTRLQQALSVPEMVPIAAHIKRVWDTYH